LCNHVDNQLVNLVLKNIMFDYRDKVCWFILYIIIDYKRNNMFFGKIVFCQKDIYKFYKLLYFVIHKYKVLIGSKI